jgi:competence protein ComEA
MAPERLAAWGAPVDVNRASVEELASLDGIGVKLAARVVAGRPYVRIEDVGRIKGIGARRLARLRTRLVLDE